MPDERPHPLRFGWYFEADLPEEAVPSVRLHHPGAIVHCPTLPEGVA